MRIVAALGGNALLKRGERPDSDIQEHNVAEAVAALAPLAGEHELIVTHGNGPQIGVLAIESADDRQLTHPYPLDTLGAETQGLIGYWLSQELHNRLPERDVAAVVTQTLVDVDDPAFDRPTKFVGPVYDAGTAAGLADERGWTIAADGDRWRRVVASPEPIEIVETGVVRGLMDAGVVVVCAGGGGVPVVRTPSGTLRGVEAVIDKDLTSALLAIELGADAFLVLTDVDGVYRDFDTPTASLIERTTPADLRALGFPDGSMGPKVEAVCRFVERAGGVAAIGALTDAPGMLAGERGTRVQPD
ncbi:MAG: carbamate kinase [Ilumatobacter sp.]|uniref:carbamate kinase n=1 Tax=Ilumatobacter sp. TaxID=1967498 RepID=UPI00260D8341|nr:carbamate kinase [Ilumatobacter sp.]MDJ0767966.1 carbamate kinase [Ilumatobacter sp.]